MSAALESTDTDSEIERDSSTSSDQPVLKNRVQSNSSNDDWEFKGRDLRQLRRTKSVSRAEMITEVERKLRKSQPDRPFHEPRDSLFSWSSGFDKFEGFMNWVFLLLLLGGTRLFLENIIKYGIRVNPLHWVLYVLEQRHRSNIYNTPVILIVSIGHFVYALLLEKLMAKAKLSASTGNFLQIIHLVVIVFIPFMLVRLSPDSFSVAGRTIICLFYIVMFLKLWSYIQVNHWCRSDRSWFRKSKRGRSQSFRKYNSTDESDLLEDISETPEPIKLVKYPDNLNLKDISYFILAPTLCYELNYPRSSRIRKGFLLRRMLEIVCLGNLLFALIQQWMIPTIKNSFKAFSDMDFMRCTERLLKLAIPSHLLWLLGFYLIFHSLLNIIGELMRFADRNYYKDWWNARDVGTFWRLWNMPVHKWAVRHVFIPMMKAKYSKVTAGFVVFMLSALLHEYLVSIPLHMYKINAFFGMLAQVPMVYISLKVANNFGDRWGNMIVWSSLILGQPLGIMVYYHDYVVKNFEPSMLEL